MLDCSAIFRGKRPDEGKLVSYGFVPAEHGYTRDFPILEGQFTARVAVTADGAADYRVYDAETGEEYFLARVPEATGPFVGEVHAACEAVLTDVADSCFYAEHYQNEQTRRILSAIGEIYGAAPEFLWKAYPDFAVFRVRGKTAWFALVGKVEKRKFGLTEEGMAEFINLKAEPETVKELLASHRAHPAYHMNKRCWYSTFLDDSLSDEELFSRIDASFAAVGS